MILSSKPPLLESTLSRYVRWQHSKLLSASIDQTQLAIADAPTNAQPFSFLVIGDTDAGTTSTSTGSIAFAQAFANQLTQQFGDSRFLLHTGDVTYPIGTFENYLHGFLRPYRALLNQCPASAAYKANSVVFNRPLLPVPGNHDYAVSGSLVRRQWRAILRSICDRIRQLTGLDLGHYGGAGGEAYATTFLDNLENLEPEQLTHHLKHFYTTSTRSLSADQADSYSLTYQPEYFTRLPNRYYTFRYGGVDFFALDSNTWCRSNQSEGFDQQQLDWLQSALLRSCQTSNTVGRILYLHHSPYTTEESRWQYSDTLWVRRHLRTVLDRVAEKLSRGEAKKNSDRVHPIVDLVISGHAHCLEHLKTTDTVHADAYMDWIVCGGSGADVRRQRQNNAEILENIAFKGRASTKVVAQSQFYAGAHGHGSKKQCFHSFIRIDVQPQNAQKFSIQPFVISNGSLGWQAKKLTPLKLGCFARSSVC